MKKLLTIASAIILLAAACSQKANVNLNTQNSTTTTQDQTVQATPTPKDETMNGQVYAGGGFELTLTNAWKGYKVFHSQGSNGVGAPDYYYFSMSTTDKTQAVINVTDEVYGYAAPLTITVIAKDRKVGAGVKITEDANSAYYYSINKNLPTDLAKINFEIPKVISTFKLTSQAAVSEKPVITNTSGSAIKGKTKPNYLVFAYLGEIACLTRNTMSTYGASKADANGNFSINIPIVAATGKISVVVAAFPETSPYALTGTGGNDGCFPESNLSTKTDFTYSIN